MRSLQEEGAGCNARSEDAEHRCKMNHLSVEHSRLRAIHGVGKLQVSIPAMVSRRY
jgi:hypothetical protein